MTEHYAYRELRGHLIRQILTGSIAEGEALPSVRCLAKAHGLNPLTVAKAIAHFPPGILRQVRGLGTFVAEGGQQRLRDLERAAFLDDHWPRIANEIARLRIDRRELLDARPALQQDLA